MPELHRRARVMFQDKLAGTIEEVEGGYRFTYEPTFIAQGRAISQSLPLKEEPFVSSGLFAFFLGLLPEGWYREIVCKKLKIDENDDFGLLVGCCKDCIGAVWIEEDPHLESM
jgi:serine/threonine-protein kinase HipA